MSEAVPVFPLPDHVLLADSPVPYRLFEPRYVALGRYLKEQEHASLVIPQVLPGSAVLSDNAPFEAVAVHAEVTALHELPDEHIALVVNGRTRVRVQEVASSHPFRMAELEPFPVEQNCSSAALAQALLQSGQRFRALLLKQGIDPADLDRYLVGADEASVLCNRLAHLLLTVPPQRQAYLQAVGWAERLHLLLRLLDGPAGPSLN